MRVPTIIFIAPIVVLSSTTNAKGVSPIRYEVIENNRIFLAGDQHRFVRDINKYIRCTAFRRGQEPVDKTTECLAYRKDGTYQGKLVPNLRSGQFDDEYRIQYDKISGKYRDDYVRDGHRRIKLFVEKQWILEQKSQPITCKWSVVTTGKISPLASSGCDPVTHEVELSLDAGGKLEWTAQVRLGIEFNDGTQSIFEVPISVRDYLIVAMGDSLTSGEGNPERNWTSATPAQWMDYRCHRSLFSYPSMMAATLALADPRHSITLVHVACSGAAIDEGMLGKYRGAITKIQAQALWRHRWPFIQKRLKIPAKWKDYGTEPEVLDFQIDQVHRLLVMGKGQRKPDLLVLSIGVNDIGLVGLLKELALKDCQDDCLDELRKRRVSHGAHCVDSPDGLDRSFACLEQLLTSLKKKIETNLAPSKTYLVEYPNPLRDENDRLCMSKPNHRELLKGVLGTFEPLLSPFISAKLSLEEIRFAETEFFFKLKQAHTNVDSKPEWVTIQHQGEEDRRGFCASPKWYHSYQESKLRQHLNPNTPRDSVGTLHPNAIGHEHLMVRILSKLRKDKTLQGHNFSLLEDPSDFHNNSPASGHGGIAWILGLIHKEDVAHYYKF